MADADYSLPSDRDVAEWRLAETKGGLLREDSTQNRGYGNVERAGDEAMIRPIVPSGVAVVEDWSDRSQGFLLPEEAAALGPASALRRREFAAGRTCARRALAELGLSPVSILIGSHREPLWPTGVVGSITHCAGYCAAVVAPRERVAAIGIDAEDNARLPEGVLDMLSVDEERQWLGTLPGIDVHWDRVLFSAKECIYKAWFTIAGRWLGFKDVVLKLDPDRATFHAQLFVAGPVVDGRSIDCFEGRFLVKNGLVITAVVLDA